MRLPDADLRRCDLSGAHLSGIDFSGSRFTKSNLRRASFKDIPGKPAQRRAIANGCNFRSVDFGGAVLDWAEFNNCDFSHAEFNGASVSHASMQDCTFFRTLMCAHFNSAKLQRSDFTEAHMLLAEFEDTDLSECRSLGAANYNSSIKVDTQTLCKSQNLPPDFFRAAGISPAFEKLFRLQSADGRRVRCFISYASDDEQKVAWLRRELEQEGIETWFAPRDLPIGAKIRDGLEDGWADCDALIVVLSASSIKSHWVEQEVEAAFERERRTNRIALVPVRIDSAIMDCKAAWGAHLRRSRNVGDLSARFGTVQLATALRKLVFDIRELKPAARK